jgi:hypothetical protein
MSIKVLLLWSTYLSIGVVTAQSIDSYSPPPASLVSLGHIASRLKDCQEVNATQFTKLNVRFICKLASGELYFDSGLELDDDGDTTTAFPTDWRSQWPHQTSTAYRTSSSPLNPMIVSYIVLPGAGASHAKPFYSVHGIAKGDGAIVVWKGHIVPAVFGDVGPQNQLGEASLHTIVQLDPTWVPFTRDSHNKNILRTSNAAYPSAEVLTIVFPGTSQGPVLRDVKGLYKVVLNRFATLRDSK